MPTPIHVAEHTSSRAVEVSQRRLRGSHSRARVSAAAGAEVVGPDDSNDVRTDYPGLELEGGAAGDGLLTEPVGPDDSNEVRIGGADGTRTRDLRRDSLDLTQLTGVISKAYSGCHARVPRRSLGQNGPSHTATRRVVASAPHEHRRQRQR